MSRSSTKKPKVNETGSVIIYVDSGKCTKQSTFVIPREVLADEDIDTIKDSHVSVLKDTGTDHCSWNKYAHKYVLHALGCKHAKDEDCPYEYGQWSGYEYGYRHMVVNINKLVLFAVVDNTQ